MKRIRSGLIWLTATVVLVCGRDNAMADAKVNPYDAIVERNPFGLKPPPPPAPPEDPSSKLPPAPLATVEVTGITSILSSKRALLEIVPGPGKPMLKPIMSEGERVDSIEVVSINVEKNEVTIKNGGTITNLTFKVAKSTPGPAAPGALPPAAPGSLPPPSAQTTLNNYGTGRSSVMMGGGAPAATPAGVPNPAYGGAASPLTGGGDSAFRSIPSRNIRANQQANLPVSAEESVLQVEQNRILNQQISQNTGIRLPPLPPTVLTPNPDNIGGVSEDGGQLGNTPYQNNTGARPGWVPRRIVAPPVPGQQ